MTETRKKKLIEEAKQFAREQMAHPMEPMLFSAEVFQNKLVELVVRECMMICGAVQGASESHNNTEAAKGAEHCKRIIARDFGITQ